MSFVDRILTIVVTATITSMVWIVAGGSLMELSRSDGQIDRTRPAEVAAGGEPITEETVTPEDEGDESTTTDTTAPRSVSRIATTDEATRPTSDELGQLIIPVLNVRKSDLTDSFLAERDGRRRLHEAIDIMAPQGTSIIAAAPGTIERIFQSKTAGNSIYIRSPDKKTIYFYAHLQDYAPGLREGQQVRRGQRLGTVGTTGNAAPDAPHLHFAIMRTTERSEWWEPKNAINPYPLLTEE